MVTSSVVRSHLVRALEAELVGPYSEHEELDRAPSRTYLTGFLVPREDRNADPLVLFQVSLEVRYEGGFLARPPLRRGAELDDQIASLQYRHVCEYAVGHGVAVEAPTTIGGKVTTVTTTWLPRSEVRRVATSDALGDGLAVEQRMAALADVADGAAVRRALGDLPIAYGRWIDEQRRTATEPTDRDTLDELVKSADDARRRIADGLAAAIPAITTDPDLLQPETRVAYIQHLRSLHEELDRAVLAAYGWSDIPVPPYCPPRPTDHAGQAAVSLFEGTIIDRLFALNAERAAEEAAAAGRPAPITTTGAVVANPCGKRAKKPSSNQPSLLDDESLAWS